MNAKDEYQPAYLLHSRPYRESSLLVDFITANYGRVTAVARGGRGGVKVRQYFQPFRPLQITWSGRGELKTLYNIEPTSNAKAIVGNSVYSAMYLNELLYRLFKLHEPVPALFACYMTCLDSLEAGDPLSQQQALRAFELELLTRLGYGIDFTQDSATATAIQSEVNYLFQIGQGFTQIQAEPSPAELVVTGAEIIALSSGHWSTHSLGLLKMINRRVLDDLLGGTPLNSRQLYRAALASGTQ